MVLPWMKNVKKDTLGKDQGMPPTPTGTTGGKAVPVNQPPPQGAGPGQMAPAQAPLTPPSQVGKSAARPVALTPQQQTTVNAVQQAQSSGMGISPPSQIGQPAARPVALTPQQQSVVDAVAAGPQAPAKTNQEIMDAAIASLLSSSTVDTTAQKELATSQAERARGQALADARARSGFAGFGLSGAATAQDADIRKLAAESLTGQLLGIDKAARDEQLARITTGIQAGLQNSQNDIQREAWKQFMASQEVDFGTDINGDGMIGGKPAADFVSTTASAEKDDALRAESQSYGDTITLNAQKKKDMESRGFVFQISNTPGWFGISKKVYVDQYGTIYDIPLTDPNSGNAETGGAMGED